MQRLWVRYFLKTLFRETTRRINWSLKIFAPPILIVFLFLRFSVIPWSLCTYTATKDILDLLFYCKLKKFTISIQTYSTLRTVGWFIQTKRTETTKHVSRHQQKSFQKPNHSLWIIYRDLHYRLFLIFLYYCIN